MLDVLRASKGGIITWIFLAAIIVMFVISFGPGSFAKQGVSLGGAPSYAAEVNGQTVSVANYERQLQQVQSFYRAQYGDEFVRIAQPQLAQQALGAVVNHALLVQEAQRRGLRVTDLEVARAVQGSPAFQEDGKFSKDLYRETTMAQYGSPHQYEEMLRDELLVERLQAAFEATIKVPESEVHRTWAKYADRVELSYVLFPTADARTEVKVTDAEVQAFAAREGARIEKFYQDNAARFDQPRKVRARHILARVEGNDDAAAKKKIDGAIARLNKGEDFAKLAAELSDDDNTKANGGDLGMISAGLADDAFAKAALALDQGKLSGPVRTPAGWHVIRVDEVVPAKKVSLQDARPEIARELLTADRGAELVKQKAEAALQAARSGKALSELFPAPQAAQPAANGRPATAERKAAITLGGKPVVAREPGAFPASTTTVPGLTGAADLLKDALAAKSGDVLPRVYETASGPVVAVVKDRKHPDETAYAKERETYEQELVSEKSQQLRQEWVAELRTRAKVVENAAILPAPQERAD
jgi:peptidyl-prolyl cis-trans isomerase D